VFDIKVNQITPHNLMQHVTIAANPKNFSGFYMFYSLQMFYANGGGPCYILSTGDFSKTFDDADGALALEALSKIDEPTMIIFTDRHAASTEFTSGYSNLYNATLALCAALKDRIAIFDAWVFTGNLQQDASAIRKEFENVNLKYGAVYYPWLSTTLNYFIDEAKVIISDVGKQRSGVPNGKTLLEVKALNMELYNRIKTELTKITIDVPPSGAVAAVIASTDKNSGVWKTLAGNKFWCVIKPTVALLSAEAAYLNVDSAEGKSINPIREFTEKGTLVWGSRTLAGNDNESRYLQIRRFFIFVKESILKAAQQFVFEPNDAGTWIKMKAMCEHFLTELWHQGAMQGAKPEQAFYVGVGLNSTMTSLDVLEGRLILEIGIAAVRPAEFIISRLQIKMASS
ncbi:MAG: phage tail sheath family protein, partial [Sphingobacteriales bacterium]